MLPVHASTCVYLHAMPSCYPNSKHTCLAHSSAHFSSRVFPTKSLALLCAGSSTLIWRLHSSLRLPESIASSMQKLASRANWRRLLFVAAVVGQKFLLPPITRLHMHLLLDSRRTQGATHQIFQAVLLQYPQLHRAHNLTISFH